MSGLSLRHFVVWFGFHGMNQVRELDGVLDEEHWDVVADDVPVSLLCIELDGEPSHIADSVLPRFWQISKDLLATDNCSPHYREILALC